jgi:hypothetical protein
LPVSFSSQPVGALNPKRAAFYAERYGAWEDAQEPASHYRQHYSSSGSVLRWLLRLVSDDDDMTNVTVTAFTATTLTVTAVTPVTISGVTNTQPGITRFRAHAHKR